MAKRKSRHAGGRPTALSGALLYKVPADRPNPRQPKSLGDKSWRAMKNGMTYEQYLAAGGRRVDLDWCIKKGYAKCLKVKATKAAKAPAAAAPKTPAKAPKTKAQPFTPAPKLTGKKVHRPEAPSAAFPRDPHTVVAGEPVVPPLDTQDLLSGDELPALP